MSRPAWLQSSLRELGAVGLAGLALLAAGAVYHLAAVKPLEAHHARLGERLATLAPRAGAARAPDSAAQLEDFYRHFDTGRETAEWLAKLHVMAKALGLTVGSADYRVHAAGERLERYEIALPLTGSYAQIRAFVRTALAEIPVLSLDHVSLRRASAAEGEARAEVRFTLYLLKP